MSQCTSDSNDTTRPALGAFLAPMAAALGPGDAMDAGLLTSARYHHGGPSLPTSISDESILTAKPDANAKVRGKPKAKGKRKRQGTWSFSGSTLGLASDRSPATQGHQQQSNDVWALGPPRHLTTIAKPSSRYASPAADALTQRGSYPKKISSLRTLHPDLGPISTNLIMDLAHEDAMSRTLPSFVLDHQGNCLAMAQSTLSRHSVVIFSVLNRTLAVSVMDTSCSPYRSSPNLAIAVIPGPPLLQLSASLLRPTLAVDPSAALTEHGLVALRSEYAVSVFRIAVSAAQGLVTDPQRASHPFAVAQLVEQVDLPDRCTSVQVSPFSASEVLISTTRGVYLLAAGSGKKVVSVVTSSQLVPTEDKPADKSQSVTTQPRRQTRRSAAIEEDPARAAQQSSSPATAEPAPDPALPTLPAILGVTWSLSPRFVFLHTATTAYLLDVRSAEPYSTLEPVWTVPTASQADAPLSSPVTIQHLACDHTSAVLVIAASPRLVLLDARHPTRIGQLATLGWDMSRELGVHLLDPVVLDMGSGPDTDCAGRPTTVVLGTASLLNHTLHLTPIDLDDNAGLAGPGRSVRQRLLPRLVPKVKEATRGNEWAHGLRNVERVKHVEYPQDAPMVGCAMMVGPNGQDVGGLAITVVQAFADGCVLARQVPVERGVAAVAGKAAAEDIASELAAMHLGLEPELEFVNPPLVPTVHPHRGWKVKDPDWKLIEIMREASMCGADGSTVVSRGDFGDGGRERLRTLVGSAYDDDGWDVATVFPRDRSVTNLQSIAEIAQRVRVTCQPPTVDDGEDAGTPSLLKSSVLRAAVKDESKIDGIEWTSGVEALAGKWNEVVAASAAIFASSNPPPASSQAATVVSSGVGRSRASAPLFGLGSKITKRGPPTLASSSQPIPSASQPPVQPKLPGFASASQQHASRVSAPLSFFSQPQPQVPPPSQHHPQPPPIDSGSWSQPPPPMSQPLTGRRSMALSFDFGFEPSPAPSQTSTSFSQQSVPPPQSVKAVGLQPDPFAWVGSASTSQSDAPASSQEPRAMPSLSQPAPAYGSRMSQGMDFGFGGMSMSQPSSQQPPRKKKRTQGF